MPEQIDITTNITTIDLVGNQQIIQLASNDQEQIVLAANNNDRVILADNNDPQVILAPASGVTILGGGNNPAVGSSLSYPIAIGTILITGKVVQIVNGELTLATIDDEMSAYSTIGVYDAALGQVVASGKISNSSWNWTLGQPLFLGRNGNLVHIPLNDSLFYLQIATVLTPTEIQINIQQPIYT